MGDWRGGAGDEREEVGDRKEWEDVVDEEVGKAGGEVGGALRLKDGDVLVSSGFVPPPGSSADLWPRRTGHAPHHCGEPASRMCGARGQRSAARRRRGVQGHAHR